MRSLVPKLLAPVAVIAALLVLAASAIAAPAVNGIFETEVEVETNNKIAAGPDGNMWFTLDNGGTKDVAKITPDGTITEYELPGVEEVAQGIAAGPDGKLWVPTINKVTSFSPSDPKGTEETFSIATINSNGQVVAGPDGQMWVASDESLVRFSTADPVGTALSIELEGKLQPKDIDVAGSLIVVANDPVTEEPNVATFTTAGAEKSYVVNGMTQGVAGSPSGQILYTAPGATPEQVGLITPPTPSPFIELPNDPFGATFGSDQAFWIANFAGSVSRVTSTGVLTTIDGLPKETARQIAAGPNNTLWITLIKKNGVVEKGAIARVTGLEPPVPPAPPIVGPPAPPPLSKVIPEAKIGKGPKGTVKTTKPRATVKFSFSSSTAGSTFQCALTHGTKTKKGKLKFGAPKFKACKAPKSYTVGPGSYRFEVRALGAGGIDPTPAKRSFRVVRTPK